MQGSTGPQGAPGSAGSEGPKGFRGRDGNAGTDGEPGIQVRYLALLRRESVVPLGGQTKKILLNHYQSTIFYTNYYKFVKKKERQILF